MKAVLFCNLPYAASILLPIEAELIRRGFTCLWYFPEAIASSFLQIKSDSTPDLKQVEAFKSDLIFVPGNHVPWFLRGVKIQVFHGLAGEKKGHFRIRQYFDLYLTQGPYFTERFKALSTQHGNFSVCETGWSKLDKLYSSNEKALALRSSLKASNKTKHIVLYAPTFSPSLSSATVLFDEIIKLSRNDDFIVLIKFHDKLDKAIIERYKACESDSLRVMLDDDIISAMRASDLMISDTSSVVYEFLLLDKPVITFNSQSENINWCNISDPSTLITNVIESLSSDSFKVKRQRVIDLYHPYNDGLSSGRMIDAALAYIKQHGVPEKRKIPLSRKFQMLKKYGLLRW
jgi:CDP-glycerol glycerophosphotransferase (TagB/SpsB family)